MKTAYHATGTRPASTLTYEQWCEQNSRIEKRKSKAIMEPEIRKYCMSLYLDKKDE